MLSLINGNLIYMFGTYFNLSILNNYSSTVNISYYLDSIFLHKFNKNSRLYKSNTIYHIIYKVNNNRNNIILKGTHKCCLLKFNYYLCIQYIVMDLFYKKNKVLDIISKYQQLLNIRLDKYIPDYGLIYD